MSRGPKGERRPADVIGNAVKYTKSKIGKFRVIEDFLPPPDKLALRTPKPRRSGTGKLKQRP